MAAGEALALLAAGDAPRRHAAISLLQRLDADYPEADLERPTTTRPLSPPLRPFAWPRHELNPSSLATLTSGSSRQTKRR
jgi:hypothetical protein